MQVHATRDTKLLARTAYTCPQCRAKIQELPADCVVCGLKLVLSPHLARSFHHLFPVAPFSELPSPPQVQVQKQLDSGSKHYLKERKKRAIIPPATPPSIILDSKLRLSSSEEVTSCFSCLRLIGTQPQFHKSGDCEEEGEETLRYRCPECKNVFCVNCDSYLHETLHNCPGCLQLT